MDQNGNRQKLDLTVQRLFDFVSKRFPFFKYSNVASQIFRFLDKFVPLKLGFLKHKKGFKWKIDGWYSLWTYLTGCEPFTTKIVEFYKRNCCRGFTISKTLKVIRITI